jgi:hypothetical protein
MHDKNRPKTGRVKVYRFRLYGIASEDFKISNRMATPACIRRIHGEIIKRTELEIDKRHLNGDGMTEVGFFDREALSDAMADDAVASWLNANSELTRAKSRCHSRQPSPWSRPDGYRGRSWRLSPYRRQASRQGSPPPLGLTQQHGRNLPAMDGVHTRCSRAWADQ